jgi:hypothetical protein
MKKGKLDFLIGIADEVREDVNHSHEKSKSTFTPAPLLPPPSTPTPPPALKQNRELKKKATDENSSDGASAEPQNIEIAGIAMTKEMVDDLERVAAEINSGMCHVRIHPEHDMQLSMLAKQLRYKHGLRGRGGISKMALIYLILDDALKSKNNPNLFGHQK